MSSQGENEIERLIQRLREAERRAEDEKRRRVEEGEEAERRAEEAERRRVEEREEAERRVEEAERRRVEEREEAEGRLEIERERSQKTTLPTFLQSCHLLLSEPLLIQTDESLTTKGSITNPRGKKHPTTLSPWLNFPEMHQQCFDQAYCIMASDTSDPPKLFSPLIAIQDLGRTLCRRPLASEKDLERYHQFAVEEKVKDITEMLMVREEAASLLGHCTGIEFENHLNTLSDNAEEVAERQGRSCVDQACVFRDARGHRSLLLVVEYKPAHKLSIEYLRAGLRPMQLREEVVQRETIPLDPGEKLNYNADRLVGAAVTQTFQYMIENGLEYSFIATGQALVFLRVLEDDPTTVYYYLAEPNMDVGEADELGFRYPFTAISRVLGFCLLAMQSEIRDQAWRGWASQLLYHWSEDFEDIIRKIPDNERQATPPSSVYRAPVYPIYYRSPYLLRSRLLGDAGPSESPLSESSSDGSDGELHHHMMAADTPSRCTGTTQKQQRTSGHGRGSTHGSSGRRRSLGYCTQKCLLGLKRQAALDPACPNFDLHRKSSEDKSHQFGNESFLQQIQAQLTADMDHDIEPLGKQGARGALFKITLTAHGYTFVGKGTVEAFVPDLRHEGKVYEQLEQLQGSAVPVCLGNSDLDRTYYLDVGVRIIHMLYMAWGGNSLHDETPAIPKPRLEEEKRRSMEELSRSHVLHNDERLLNMLWNVETKRVMLIDFERSTISKSKRQLDASRALRESQASSKRRQPYQGKTGLTEAVSKEVAAWTTTFRCGETLHAVKSGQGTSSLDASISLPLIPFDKLSMTNALEAIFPANCLSD